MPDSKSDEDAQHFMGAIPPFMRYVISRMKQVNLDFTPSQVRVRFNLLQEPQTLGKLAEFMMVTPATKMTGGLFSSTLLRKVSRKRRCSSLRINALSANY